MLDSVPSGIEPMRLLHWIGCIGSVCGPRCVNASLDFCLVIGFTLLGNHDGGMFFKSAVATYLVAEETLLFASIVSSVMLWQSGVDPI